jgi:hypothetical protein
MTALTLSRAGVNISRLQRSGDSGRTGAAIHVGDGLLESITGLDHSRAPQACRPGSLSTAPCARPLRPTPASLPRRPRGPPPRLSPSRDRRFARSGIAPTRLGLVRPAETASSGKREAWSTPSCVIHSCRPTSRVNVPGTCRRSTPAIPRAVARCHPRLHRSARRDRHTDRRIRPEQARQRTRRTGGRRGPCPHPNDRKRIQRLTARRRNTRRSDRRPRARTLLSLALLK